MKNKHLILLNLLLVIFFTADAQPITPAWKAYDTVQGMRNKANDLFNKDTITYKYSQDCIHLLSDALRYMDSIPIFELAKGNNSLKGRKHDIYFDLAQIYAETKQNDQAIAALNKMFAEGSISEYIQYLQTDTVFTGLRSDPRFIAIEHKLKRQGDLYGGTALKTPYVLNLPDEEKVAGLSLLWSQAKYNFVYFDHLDIDWNKTYLDYLNKVKDTKTTAEYYKVLQMFYAQLKDGHTNVYPPDTLDNELYARPPIRTELIEGRVFITGVYSESLKNTGVLPGMEILKINSEPVISYADKYVRPYQSSSTPQDMEIREYSYALLCGSKKEPIVLELKDNKGKTITKTISRSYDDTKYTASSLMYQAIGDIGYLALNNFEDKSLNKKFDSLFTTISKTKGLIIDIRNNGGGSGDIGFDIISKLTDKPFKISASKNLKYISEPNEEVEWHEDLPENIKPDGKLCYTKPVILLVGPRTFSAAEDFAVAFKYMKRGKLIGQATGGSTGQPVMFDLPGNGSARVCGKRDAYPDGVEFVGIGVIPDIVVTPTIKDLQDKNDAAKMKALALLNSK